MSAYYLSPAARAALVDIYEYTTETWGEAQADAYLDGMFACFAGIASGDMFSRPIPAEFEVAGSFARYEKHLIYWRRRADGEVAIVAVLPVAMLQGERLREAVGVGIEPD